jgi:hypothetical protein
VSWTLPVGLLQKHLSDVFFETGTHIGGGVSLALNVGFKKIYSIDIEERHYIDAKKKFKENKNVFLFHGSSSSSLFSICSAIPIENRITFWLDGHLNNASDQNVICPLLKELEQIGRLSNKTHNILIDDVRMFGRELIHTKEDVEKAVLGINSSYKIQYVDNKVASNDILLATV